MISLSCHYHHQSWHGLTLQYLAQANEECLEKGGEPSGFTLILHRKVAAFCLSPPLGWQWCQSLAGNLLFVWILAHLWILTFSDENVLAREECGIAQPYSAPGLKALPFTTQGPSLCKHTPFLKAAGLSSFPPALRCLLVET